MVTLDQKIKWLLRHYPYKLSRAWYESKPKATNSIYAREYAKYTQAYKVAKMEQLRKEKEPKTTAIAQRSMELFGRPISELTLEEKHIMFKEARMLV